MEKQSFLTRAHALGFDRVYFLRPQVYAPHKNPKNLPLDPFVQLPGIKSIVTLIKACQPDEKRENEPHVALYYVASNQAHHAARALAGEFGLAPAMLPIKSVLAAAGLGSFGKNGLIALPEFGSYFNAQLLLSRFFEPDEDRAAMPAGNAPPLDPQCENCSACEQACPMSAIRPDGLDVHKCVRWKMIYEPFTEELAGQLTELLGCEACQRCCPRSAAVASRSFTPEEHAALSLAGLLTLPFEDAPLAALLGINSLKKDWPRAQALCAATRMGRSEFSEAARVLLNGGAPTEQAAARFYLANFAKNAEKPQ